MTETLPWVFDCGAHNGDDTAYYLAKGYRVLAIDAHEDLVRQLKLRFDPEIATGRVVVLHRALVGREQAAERAVFYRNVEHSVLSSLFGHPEDPHLATSVVWTARLPDLMTEFGVPHFLKIDVEHADLQLLDDLYRSRFRPYALSVEIHDPRTAALALAMGYDLATLVDGHDVHSRFANHVINTPEGPRAWNFPVHAAGPCLDDLHDWVSVKQLLARGVHTGWRDLHLRMLK